MRFGSLSHCLQSFIPPRRCRISSTNSSFPGMRKNDRYFLVMIFWMFERETKFPIKRGAGTGDWCLGGLWWCWCISPFHEFHNCKRLTNHSGPHWTCHTTQRLSMSGPTSSSSMIIIVLPNQQSPNSCWPHPSHRFKPSKPHLRSGRASPNELHQTSQRTCACVSDYDLGRRTVTFGQRFIYSDPTLKKFSWLVNLPHSNEPPPRNKAFLCAY